MLLICTSNCISNQENHNITFWNHFKCEHARFDMCAVIKQSLHSISFAYINFRNKSLHTHKLIDSALHSLSFFLAPCQCIRCYSCTTTCVNKNFPVHEVRIYLFFSLVSAIILSWWFVYFFRLCELCNSIHKNHYAYRSLNNNNIHADTHTHIQKVFARAHRNALIYRQTIFTVVNFIKYDYYARRSSTLKIDR